MLRIVAAMLIGLLVALPVWAGQQEQRSVDWEKAKKLKAGTGITLAVRGLPPAKVRVLYVDDSVLVTLKPTVPKLPYRVEQALIGFGRNWPGILNGRVDRIADPSRDVLDRGVYVEQGGVYLGTRKVADLAEVAQQTARTDVIELGGPPSHLGRNILLGALTFVAVVVGLCILGVPMLDIT